MSFLSFSDNLLQDNQYHFSKKKKKILLILGWCTKYAHILVWGAVPPERKKYIPSDKAVDIQI